MDGTTRDNEPFLTLLRRSFGVWFGGIWLAVGLPFVLLAAWFLAGERRFAAEAGIADGMVISKDVHRSSSRSSSGSRRTSTTYSVTYRFALPDGATYEGQGDLRYDRWLALRERGAIAVEYLQERPQSNRVAGERKTALLLMFVSLGLVLSGVGGTIAFVSGRAVWIRSRLRREGVSAAATIVRVAPMNLHINGRQQWRIEYEYRDYEGRLHGQKTRVPADEARRWKVGDTVPIRIDRNRPGRAVLSI